MVDLAFALQGKTVPRDYRRPLAAALELALPWLTGAPGAGVHRLNLSPGAGEQALLAQRTRLVLRLPREGAGAARALEGQCLDLAGHPLQVGRLQTRELLPWNTLYAHLVASASADEAAFMQEVDAELQQLGVPCRPICGRHQTLEAGTLQGFGLMLDGLTAAAALQLLQLGLGRHRRLGCGLFVPHRSAAAVGTPT